MFIVLAEGVSIPLGCEKCKWQHHPYRNLAMCFSSSDGQGMGRCSHTLVNQVSAGAADNNKASSCRARLRQPLGSPGAELFAPVC